MTRRKLTGLAVLAPLMLGLGCAMTTVKKNPGSHDCGMRYYLPKPYLLVDRAEIPADAEGKTTKPSNNVVRLKLEYLPDFSEEYSVHIRTGIGKNESNLVLTDGWRLDKIDVNVDSKATEFVEALTKLLGTDPKLLQPQAKPGQIPGGGGPALDAQLTTLTVEAHDVPLGYYEAVVSPGPDGKKRLYGFRYVGFAPYANCPLAPSGSQTVCCQAGELYGLVSVGKKMYFRKLSDLEAPNKVVVPPMK